MADCKQGCGRIARSRGWCTSHYRMWRAGKPLDQPIRGYQRFEEARDGSCQPATKVIPRREPVFAKELALLKSLGLR